MRQLMDFSSEFAARVAPGGGGSGSGGGSGGGGGRGGRRHFAVVAAVRRTGLAAIAARLVAGVADAGLAQTTRFLFLRVMTDLI